MRDESSPTPRAATGDPVVVAAARDEVRARARLATAMDALRDVKERLRRRVRADHEHAARDCAVCPTPGACCTDPHFVNVEISRLEAALIEARLSAVGELEAVRARAADAVRQYQVAEGAARTYACPLFVLGRGCLAHDGGAKPAPCILHGCYEREEDLPPLSLQQIAEAEVELLNREAFDRAWRWRPLPLWLADGADGQGPITAPGSTGTGEQSQR